ncbi:MAG: TIGR01777 family oxidoreductase [Bdellovibrionota bacterium]
MKIAIFGATGFIGSELVKAIQGKGWEALALDIRKDPTWEEKLKTADAVINLAGHPLFKNRWDTRVKALIHDSRVDGTHKIVAALKNTQVKTLVNASAIGIYGASEEDVNEKSQPADDFLARVCKNWESEATAAQRLYNIRTVIVRIGVVMGKGGGALEKLLPPFKLGLGGPIGMTGSQSMNWVHVDDVVGIMLFAIENEKVAPILNATSPNIVSNKEFSQTLGKVLHRPAIFPLPKAVLYAVVGEAAGVIAAGQRAHPQATLASGYTFKHPDLNEALTNILKS